MRSNLMFTTVVFNDLFPLGKLETQLPMNSLEVIWFLIPITLKVSRQTSKIVGIARLLSTIPNIVG